MSQENVEVVRAHFEASQRDDLDLWLATMDPTVEWHAGVERLVAPRRRSSVLEKVAIKLSPIWSSTVEVELPERPVVLLWLL